MYAHIRANVSAIATAPFYGRRKHLEQVHLHIPIAHILNLLRCCYCYYCTLIK